MKAATERGRRRHNLTRHKEGGRESDQHGINVLEAAGGQAFIFDAVLGANDGHRCTSCLLEFSQSGFGILRLHRHDDDVSGLPIDLARMSYRGDTNVMFAFRGFQQEAVGTNRFEVRAAADEDHVMAAKRETSADGAANAARSVNDESHE